MGLVVFHLQAMLFYLELLTKIHSWMILVGSWGCSSQHLGSFCSLLFSSLTIPHTFMKHLLSSRQGGRKENRHFIIQHRSWTQGRRGGIWGMGRYMSESSIPSFSLFTDSYRRYPCLSTDADIFLKFIFLSALYTQHGALTCNPEIESRSFLQLSNPKIESRSFHQQSQAPLLVHKLSSIKQQP